MKNSQITSGLWKINNSRGQAIIEYTLMLIITVSLLLALTNLIFKPFGEFISDYFGKYTACLLEYGELPSIGAENPSAVDEDSECDRRFKPGTLAEGRPPVSSERSDAGGNKSSNKNSSENSQNQSSSSGGGYAGSSSRGGGGSTMGRRGGGRGIEGGGGAREGKVVEIALEKGPNNGFFSSNNNSIRYGTAGRKTRSIGITGLTEAERKKLEKKADGTATLIPTDGRMVASAKKMAVKPPPEKMVLEESESMTIGNFIRYLFIAALVIALVIFIGGQALQMSKGGEK